MGQLFSPCENSESDSLKDELRNGVLSEESERDGSVSDVAKRLKERVMAEGMR